MKIVIIGGTGLIGSKLVANLRQKGHDVLAASPSTGVNAVTGEGLDDALVGADVVVDVSNSPSFEAQAVMDFFQLSGKNLHSAELKAGVKHHVALSVVGTSRLQESGYFRAKEAQENLIKNSGVPFTILQATQFFEFVKNIVEDGIEGDTVRMPAAVFQPVCSDDVVNVLSELAVEDPLNSTVEVAGPEKIPMHEIARKYLALNHDARDVIVDEHALYFGVAIDDASLTPKEGSKLGLIRFDQWIQQPGNLK